MFIMILALLKILLIYIVLNKHGKLFENERIVKY